MGDWRKASYKAIREVINANPGLSEKELRKKISEAYPFGQRAMHPYKVWLSEVKVQVALHFKRPHPQPGLLGKKTLPPPDPNQETLL
jgi:hypothetical protein